MQTLTLPPKPCVSVWKLSLVRDARGWNWQAIDMQRHGYSPSMYRMFRDRCMAAQREQLRRP